MCSGILRITPYALANMKKVSSVPSNLTRYDIRRAFAIFGSPAAVYLGYSKDRTDKLAVIQFRSSDETRSAVLATDNSKFLDQNSKPIAVDFAEKDKLPSFASRLRFQTPQDPYLNTSAPSETFSVKEKARLNAWIAARKRGKPLQYILGTQPFAGIDIALRRPILIPRPETEFWALRLIEILRLSEVNLFSPTSTSHLRILDLCGGTGCIGLSLAYRLGVLGVKSLRAQDPRSVRVDVVIADFNPSAVRLSAFNARRIGVLSPIQPSSPVPLSKHSVSVRTLLADVTSPSDLELLARIPEPHSDPVQRTYTGYDIIVSNPPYITPSEYTTLDTSVLDWESSSALVPDGSTQSSDPNGVRLAKAIAHDAAGVLLREDVLRGKHRVPRLLMEIGGKHQVKDIFGAMDCSGSGVGRCGFTGFKKKDVWNMFDEDRVVVGC
ncbi:S-adenosyl-L-methionine-dependent methyltransferase [Cladochytrium replicatum]|nr:S-adenosyl-L-methionine-dependent methyltransferase [Cladochytrium replicatum]